VIHISLLFKEIKQWLAGKVLLALVMQNSAAEGRTSPLMV
jgi:hypothetical protein